MSDPIKYKIDNKIIIELDNNILFAHYNSCIIDIELAKKIVAERIKFTKNKIAPAIISATGVVEITKDARKYFSSSKGTDGLSIIALVYENSTINQFLMNFMLKMHTPIIPVKIFKSKEKAILWINSKKENSSNQI